MTEVMLNVLDQERSIHARTSECLADAAMAAVAADPCTIGELEAAMRRFHAPPHGGYFDNFEPGLCDEPYGIGLVVVDLSARLTVCQCSTGEPLLDGAVSYYDGRRETDTWMCFSAPPDWMLVDRSSGWRAIAERRRRDRLARQSLDTRAVIYGRVWDFIVPQLVGRLAEAHPEEAIMSVHADWLLTAHPELGGRSPREVLLEYQPYIDRDLEDQARHWSLLLESPPGLSPDAHAYRFGGYGSNEIIVYYDMVQDLVRDSIGRLRNEDFRAEDEIERLRRLQQDWMSTPRQDYGRRTPAQVIARERSRLPWAVFGDDKMVDCDCPMCQMIAEDPSPSFWALDASHMHDDFAFSFSRTRADWELDGGLGAELSREASRELADRDDGPDPRYEWADTRWEPGPAAPKDLPPILAPLPECNGPWTRSYSDPRADDGLPKETALKMRLFGIGAHLTELSQDLNDCALDADGHPGPLLRNHFSRLRAAVRDESWWTVKSVVAEFCGELVDTAVRCPDLARKCADLERQLDEYSALCDESVSEP